MANLSNQGQIDNNQAYISNLGLLAAEVYYVEDCYYDYIKDSYDKQYPKAIKDPNNEKGDRSVYIRGEILDDLLISLETITDYLESDIYTDSGYATLFSTASVRAFVMLVNDSKSKYYDHTISGFDYCKEIIDAFCKLVEYIQSVSNYFEEEGLLNLDDPKWDDEELAEHKEAIEHFTEPSYYDMTEKSDVFGKSYQEYYNIVLDDQSNTSIDDEDIEDGNDVNGIQSISFDE